VKPPLFATFSLVDRLKIVLATLGGVGFSPKMPGTIGSFAALAPIALATALVDKAGTGFTGLSLVVAIGIVSALFVGLWVVPVMEKHWGNDPGCVVIDEFVGMWVVLLFVLLNPLFSHSLSHLFVWMTLGFALFRLFDITKPFPIYRLNEQKGAFFVMFDDVLAGLYACGGLFLIWLIWQQFGK